MKIFIFLPTKPLITETFIINELEALEKSGIEFLVGYLSQSRLKKRQKSLQRFEKKFIYIQRLPKNIFKRIIHVLNHQIRTFISHPIRYTRILIWILTHCDRAFFRDYIKIARITPIIDKFQPDLFYCRYSGNPLTFSFLASKFYGKKFGIISYYAYPRTHNIESINKEISFIIAKANYIKEKYLHIHPDLDVNKIKVIPWGIDTDFFRLPHKLKKKNTQFTILAISQLAERKGLVYLLKACSLLAKENISFQCRIIGDGSEKKQLEKFIKINGLRSVIRLEEGIPHSKKFIEFMSNTDVFVLPSIIGSKGEVDVIPNVLLEAMAMELPVITTRVGGMFEVIKNGYNGFFVKDKDEKDLARIILKIMNMPIDNLKVIGLNARKTIVEYWNKEVQGKKIVKLLRSQV